MHMPHTRARTHTHTHTRTHTAKVHTTDAHACMYMYTQVCDFPDEFTMASPFCTSIPHLGASTEEAESKSAAMAAQQAPEQQKHEAEMKAAEQAHGHAEAEHGRNQEKHEMEMEQLKAQAAADAVHHGGHGNALKDAAKQFGASGAANVGGKPIANPINKLDGNG